MGNSKYLTLNKPEFLDEISLWSAPFGLKLLDFIIYRQNITAIDLGFETGFPFIELAMRLGKNSVIYGIDEWKEGIERTKNKIEYYKLENVKIIEGSAESIPLENNSVNLITSNNCLNSVENLEHAIKECSRISQKDGQFIQTMNLDKTMFEFNNILEKILLELELKQNIDLLYKYIEIKRPSIDKILNMMKKEFIIKDIEYDEFSYRFSNGTSMLNHYFIKNVFKKSWDEILPANRKEEIYGLVEKEFNEYSESHTGIKLSIPYVLINSVKR